MISLFIFENILLPNELIILRNHEDDDNMVKEEVRGVEGQQGRPCQVGGPNKVDFDSVSESRNSVRQNGRPGRIRSPFGTFFIWMER